MHTNTWMLCACMHWKTQLTILFFTVSQNSACSLIHWSVDAKLQSYTIVMYMRCVIYEVNFQRFYTK